MNTEVFENSDLQSAVLWGLMQGDLSQEQALTIMDMLNPTRLLSMAAEAVFCAGYNPRNGQANVLREALITLNTTGVLPE